MGQIKVEKNVGGIEGLAVITPTVHGDDRGYFMETFNQRDMMDAGFSINFVQDNQSSSTKGVLRGLHFQKKYPQIKLVRAVRGSVFDVAVDLRSESKTYGKWYGVTKLMTSGIQTMKVVWLGTILKLALNGHTLKVITQVVQMLLVTLLMMVPSSTWLNVIKNGRA